MSSGLTGTACSGAGLGLLEMLSREGPVLLAGFAAVPTRG